MKRTLLFILILLAVPLAFRLGVHEGRVREATQVALWDQSHAQAITACWNELPDNAPLVQVAEQNTKCWKVAINTYTHDAQSSNLSRMRPEEH